MFLYLLIYWAQVDEYVRNHACATPSLRATQIVCATRRRTSAEAWHRKPRPCRDCGNMEATTISMVRNLILVA